jgi:hypothetical protein
LLPRAFTVNCALEVPMFKLFALSTILLAACPNAAAPAPRAHATARPSAAPLSPDALFSRRALRRAKLLIQMRMFQFRDERLECVRAALIRQLPPDLRPAEPASPSPPPDACLR